MSSAETNQPIEWRDDGFGGQTAWLAVDVVGAIWPAVGDTPAGAWFADTTPPHCLPPKFFTKDAARSFVEKSVKEAGHEE